MKSTQCRYEMVILLSLFCSQIQMYNYKEMHCARDRLSRTEKVLENLACSLQHAYIPHAACYNRWTSYLVSEAFSY